MTRLVMLLAAPRIMVAPQSQTTKRDATVVFNCVAEGEPKPQLTWMFNGGPIPTIRGHYELAIDSTSLYVHNASFADAGYYSCRAMNTVGSASVDARLTVEGKVGSENSGYAVYTPSWL